MYNIHQALMISRIVSFGFSQDLLTIRKKCNIHKLFLSILIYIFKKCSTIRLNYVALTLSTLSVSMTEGSTDIGFCQCSFQGILASIFCLKSSSSL